MKTKLSFFAFLAASVLCLSNAFAQEFMKNYLPEGARTRIGKGQVHHLAYSPDSTRLAVASSIGIWLYDAHTGQPLDLFTGHTRDVSSVDFSPDGHTLASSSYDGTIRLWDVNTGELKTTLTGHKGSVYSVAFSPDGDILASGGRDEFIRFWNVKSGELHRTIAGHAERVSNVLYSPDGEMLMSSGYDEKIHVWDADTGEFIKTLQPHPLSDTAGDSKIYCMALSPDSKTVGTGNSSGIIRLWDVNTAQLKLTLTGNADGVYAIAVSPDGKTFVTGGNTENVDGLQLWDIATGEPVKNFKDHSDRVTSLVFSPDGSTLASYSPDNALSNLPLQNPHALAGGCSSGA